MSVRKRTWKTRKGEQREAFVVDYYDRAGSRTIETFERRKDAVARQAEVAVKMRAGTHVAPSKSATVRQAGEAWLEAAAASGLEQSTLAQYRQHLRLHIEPFIGSLKLADLNAPAVRDLEDKLRQGGRSRAMIKKTLASLGSLVADAQERGLAGHNAVRELHRNRRRGKSRQAERREKGKVKVGVDVPTPQEIMQIIAHAQGRWRPFIITAVFTGLRASELRGLRWRDVDLKAGELHVRQRADRYGKIGKPKSAAGERMVPFGKVVTNALKEWKLACPKGELDLVFPTGAGNIESLGNIINRGLIPTQLAAGVTKGKVTRAKYGGMHALRHFYASWCINRPADGGLGLPPKVVQGRLGHASIMMTMDVYGHLFPRGDDGDETDAAELRLVQ